MIPTMNGRQRAARTVAARRGELGLTQQELADAAGVDSKTIYNLESRGRWPIARTRARMEKALGWPVGEMEHIAENGDDPEPDPDILPDGVRDDIRRGASSPEAAAHLELLFEAFARGEPLPVAKRRRAGR